MGQIGYHIPAEFASYSLIDKIFTRMGSYDQIFLKKSTFYIELEETKRLIENSTVNSLVVIDELGRGTSTYDGVAIAC